MGAVAWGPLAIAPFPTPAHQTGRADFRHPAFRLASQQGTRRDRSGQALEAQDAEFSMNGPRGPRVRFDAHKKPMQEAFTANNVWPLGHNVRRVFPNKIQPQPLRFRPQTPSLKLQSPKKGQQMRVLNDRLEADGLRWLLEIRPIKTSPN